jgi:transcription antitermination factor NusG
MTMKNWYAVHTKVNHEKKVSRILSQRNIETYVPEMQFGSRDQVKIRPFFPGYLFMRLDLDTANPAHWQWTPGLRRIVAYGRKPIPVPEEVILLIKHKLDEMASKKGRRSFDFEPGDIVRIKEGPFEDMLAIFDKETSPDGRVQVLLTALNRSVRLSIAGKDLEKTSKEGKKENGTTGKRPRRTRGRGRHIRRS